MSDVMYEKITVANVSELKSDDEIFSFNTGTNAYEKVKYESAIGSKYGEILEEKAKMDRAKADELGEAKEQDKTKQSNYDTSGPSGAPQAVAFVLANNPNNYQYKLAFFKLYKKQIDTNTGAQRSYMENGSSGVETRVSWGYVALFSPMRIFNDANADIVARFVTSQFLECGDSKTFSAAEFFNRAASSSNFNSIGTPIGLISFDMIDNINSMQLLSKYNQTNFKDGKWVIPVTLSNPKCIHVRRDNCGLISGYTVAPNQNATDQDAIDTLKQNIATSEACKSALSTAIGKAEDNNKSSWFTFKKTRQAKIKAEINAALASPNMQGCVTTAGVNTSNDTIENMQYKFRNTHDVLSKQLLTNSKQQTPTQMQLVYYDEQYKKFTNHPTALFFIDPAPDMSLGNLVLLVANACKSIVGGKRTLRKGRSHQFKKTKNKKYKKYGTSRRGQRHKYSMRRKRIH